MTNTFQQEFFNTDQYTRICSICRKEFPRTKSFFPEGRTKDGMSTICCHCTQYRLSSKTGESPVHDEISLQGKKSCEDCGQLKPLTDFYMDSNTTDCKSLWCKDCSMARYEERQKRIKLFGENAWAVFFIQDTRNLRVKIGCSSDPHESFSILQQASSVILKLLVVLEAESQTEAASRERELHQQFADCYTGHGWFECFSDLQQYIALIQREVLSSRYQPLSNPPMRMRSRRNLKHPEAVRVEGQIFPNLSAASAATGYSPEQIEVLRTETELLLPPSSKNRT